MISPQRTATNRIASNVGHIGIAVNIKTAVAGKIRGKDCAEPYSAGPSKMTFRLQWTLQ